jgi:Lon protease-like protein
MTADALAGDHLIAMALLRPGWEMDYDGRPDIHPVVCLGKIVSDQRLEDGRYNILLQGLSRARIVEELAAEKLYRVARLELLSSIEAIEAPEDQVWRRRLDERVPGWFAEHAQLIEHLQKLLASDLPLGILGDLLSFALPLGAESKQELLEELDVGRRLHRLLEYVPTTPPASSVPANRRFPPDFSTN